MEDYYSDEDLIEKNKQDGPLSMKEVYRLNKLMKEGKIIE